MSMVWTLSIKDPLLGLDNVKWGGGTSALSQICTSFALKPCDQQTWDCTREKVLLKRLGSYMCAHNHIICIQLDNHLSLQQHLRTSPPIELKWTKKEEMQNSSSSEFRVNTNPTHELAFQGRFRDLMGDRQEAHMTPIQKFLSFRSFLLPCSSFPRSGPLVFSLVKLILILMSHGGDCW